MCRVVAYLVVLIFVPLSYVHGQTPRLRTDNKCLKGSNHKEFASPEGAGYAACHQFQAKSCCTSNFTQQLARASVTNIDNFYWNRCGNLSKRCEEFMIGVECFYRCSPNAVHWEGQFPSSINRLPVCHQFCDDWYEACRSDSSCATNWVTDYNRTSDGTNHCSSTSQCLTWERRYGSGRMLCDTLWGSTFNYTTDANQCLKVNASDLVSFNTDAAQRILNSRASSAQTWLFHWLLALLTACFCLSSAHYHDY